MTSLDGEITEARREALREEQLCPLPDYPSPAATAAWRRHYVLLRRAGRGLPSRTCRWSFEVPANTEVTTLLVLDPRASSMEGSISPEELALVEEEWRRCRRPEARKVVLRIPRGDLTRYRLELLARSAYMGVRDEHRTLATTVLEWDYEEVALQSPSRSAPVLLPIPFYFEEAGTVEGSGPEFLRHAVVHGRTFGAPRSARSPEGAPLVPTEGWQGWIANPHRTSVRPTWWKVSMEPQEDET